MKLFAFICFVLLVFSNVSFPAEIQLSASKDNTLYESTSQLSNGAGDHFFAGRTWIELSARKRRGLIAFNLTAIPQEAKITGVSLTLHMSRTKPGNGPRTVTLHRVLQDWGEEDSHAPANEGGGASASVGDATWDFAKMRTNRWETAGGDFVQGNSASQVVDGIEYYTWGSTEPMVADVQDWVSNPSENFGWLIKGNETDIATAKRFDSRTNPTPAYRPLLPVEYEAPDVYISEVFQYPEKEGFPGEFIEIHNVGRIEQNLAGWMLMQPNLELLTILDEKSLLNGDLILEPNEYAVIGRGSADEFQNLWGFLPDTYFSEGNSSDAGAPQINDGAYWRLHNSFEDIVDRYGDPKTFQFSSRLNHYTRINYPNRGVDIRDWLADTGWGNPGTDNLAPVAVNDNVDVNEDGSITINILSNDSDLDGALDSASVEVTAEPRYGAITNINEKDGRITYEPNENYNGEDVFRYVVSDDKGKQSNEARVFINVASTNDAPVISDLPVLELNEDGTLRLALTSLYEYVDDPDTPDEELILNISDGQNVKTSSDGADAILSPRRDWYGRDTLLLEVSDGKLSDRAELYVIVYSINDPPEISGLPKSLALNADSTEDIPLWDYVADVETPDDMLIYSFEYKNDSLLLNLNAKTGVLSLSAIFGLNTDVALGITVTDDSGATAMQEIIIQVETVSALANYYGSQLPAKFELNQNYPNPFNPSTSIEFALPKSEYVELKVFNMLGREVADLVSQNLEAGVHQYRFDASELASGVYFYQIMAGEFTSVKKMILIR